MSTHLQNIFLDRSMLATALKSRHAILTVAIGGLYGSLRFRILPVSLMRFWFAVTITSITTVGSILTYLIDPLRYLGVPKRITQDMCTLLMSTAFKAITWLNPQIQTQISFDDTGSELDLKSWSDLPQYRAIIAMNHTSFWDTFSFIHALPLSYLIRTRALMKNNLKNIPLFGGMVDRVGHFPVYFRSDQEGNFQVDKEKQATVQKRVVEHLEQGRCLAVFPEGAVNKDPSSLQTFRYGTFTTAFEQKIPVYYFVAVNNNVTWPRKAALGGIPADIKICIGYYPIDFEKDTPKDVAEKLRIHMQAVYDRLSSGK